MNLLPRLPRRNWFALMAGAAAIMVVHTGPLVRPELIAREQNMAKLNGAHRNEARAEATHPAGHPYVGMWVTADGHIRHELLPNGRYDEQRGARKSAYRGRYAIVGNHIDYVDDTGFTADGDFVDGVLHHGGMIFYREH
jgi:hypothetical protein